MLLFQILLSCLGYTCYKKLWDDRLARIILEHAYNGFGQDFASKAADRPCCTTQHPLDSSKPGDELDCFLAIDRGSNSRWMNILTMILFGNSKLVKTREG